jgi:hypothetical protein
MSISNVAVADALTTDVPLGRLKKGGMLAFGSL